MIARRFRLAHVPGETVRQNPILTLRPHPRLLMNVAARHTPVAARRAG